MAKLEMRDFGSKKFLIVLSENDDESQLIDRALGKKIPSPCSGSVELADGYGQHYIRLQMGVKES